MAKITSNGNRGGILEGKSHDEGGMPAIIKSTNTPVELEGKELIINGKSATSNKEYTVTGTPREIASAINSVDDNGVKFDSGAVLKDHQTGEIKKMKLGGELGDYKKYLLYLHWFNKNK